MSRRPDLPARDNARPGDPQLLDGHTAERILSRSVPPADAPPGYAGVVRLLEAACRPPGAAELAGEVEAVGQIAATLTDPRRCPVPSPKMTKRLAAATLAGGLVLTGGFAGAGALPDPAQNAAAAILERAGIHIPTSGGDAGDEFAPAARAADDDADLDSDLDSGIDADIDAGLGIDDEVEAEVMARSRPTAPAGAHNNHGQEVSTVARQANPGPGHGTEVCRVASKGKCKPGQGGQDGDDHEQDEKFARQTERCTERGETQADRFRSRNQDAQAQGAEERAQACRDRFEEKGRSGGAGDEAGDEAGGDAGKARGDAGKARGDAGKARGDAGKARGDADGQEEGGSPVSSGDEHSDEHSDDHSGDDGYGSDEYEERRHVERHPGATAPH